MIAPEQSTWRAGRALGLVMVTAGAIVGCSNSDAASDPYADTGNLTTTAGTAEGGMSNGTTAEDSQGEGPSVDLGGDDHPVCDVWAQDCPSEFKCTWEQIDGVPYPACVPIEPDAKAPGEPCVTFGDPGSGHDDCELGAMCTWLDQGNAGICLALCQGSIDEPTCVGLEPPALCLPCSECPSLCIPTCDPLDDQCGPGYACMPSGDNFTCLPLEQLGEGGLGDACEYAIQCQAGFACVDGTSLPGCDAAGCCSPFCDLTMPACPAELVCAPWLPGLEMPPLPDVGVCLGA